MNKSYETFYQKFVPAVLRNHEHFRLEETNSLSRGGADGVSNSFASALWALDCMHWWASHDADGINFHTGDRRVRNETEVPGGYAISYSTPSGLKTHPIAYALKAFTFASEGQTIPISMQWSAEPQNFTAYGVLTSDKSLVLTLINKESGSDSPDVKVTIRTGTRYSNGEVLLLQSPNNDVSLLSGTMLGGAALAGDGSWNGMWNKLSAPDAGEFALQLPAAAAAVIRLKAN